MSEAPNTETETIRMLIDAGGGIPDADLDPALTASLERLEQLQIAWRVGGERTPPMWALFPGAVRVYCPAFGLHVVTGYALEAGYGVYRNGDVTDDQYTVDGPYFTPGEADGRCLIIRDVELAHEDTIDDYTVVPIEDLIVADPYLQVSNMLTSPDGLIHLSEVAEGIQALLDALVAAGIAHQDHSDPLGGTWLSRPKVYHPESDRYGTYQRPGDSDVTCCVDFGADTEEVSLFALIAVGP